jgi:protein translocase SecG subunit
MIAGILLMAFILIQPQGTGLGNAWGGEGRFYHTKRGAEKIIFSLTIFTAIVFLVLSLINFIFN